MVLKWGKNDDRLRRALTEANVQRRRADRLEKELRETLVSLREIRGLLEEADDILDTVNGETAILTPPGLVAWRGVAKLRSVEDHE